MKIVVVVGSGSGCGKTTVVCRILRAIPGLGALKLSPRDGESRVERGPGDPGKDTDLYAGSGAALVARIVGPREAMSATWASVKPEFRECRGVVIEGTRGIDFPEEKCVLFVAGRPWLDAGGQHNRGLMAISAAIIEMPSHNSAPAARQLINTSHRSGSTKAHAPDAGGFASTMHADFLDTVRGFLMRSGMDRP